MLKIKEKFNKTMADEMMKKFRYKNILAVPKINKVVLNIGVGSMKDEAKKEVALKTLTLITGQKPLVNKAKKSIASFKSREGMIIGYSVTLRNQKMYDFLNKLISVAIPRVRDFRGLDPKTVDQMGNLSIGFKEHVAFPEVAEDDVRSVHGLSVTVVNTAKKREEALELLKLAGFPFKK